jgi:holo-[acyl-carrier protein] synthase
MIIGIGTDIIDVQRIERVIERNGGFINKVFTPQEIAYCEARAAKAQSYAARFAAKEAMMKALGTGWGEGVNWQDIEVVSEASGKPRILLSGQALATAKAMGAEHWHLSLSHERTAAIAFVVLDSGGTKP